MGRGTLLLSAIAGTLLGPVGVAHGACVKSSKGSLVEARMDARSVELSGARRVWATTLRVCNRRTGRTTVVRRARLVMKQSELSGATLSARGRSIVSVSAAGRYVAWAEVSAASRDRAAVIVRLAEFPTGRVVHERVSRRRGYGVYGLQVALVVNQWGELVWSNNGVWLWRTGRHPTRLDRGEAEQIQLLDDGRTVEWGPGRFFDLRRLPLRGGCPDRENFETVVSTQNALVTRARVHIGVDGTFGDEVALIVWRTCWRSTHRDVVVYHALDGYKQFPAARLGGYTEPWLLIANRIAAPEYSVGRLRLVNVATGAIRSFGEAVALGQPAWQYEFDAVLLADGSVAWFGEDNSGVMSTRYAVVLTRTDGSEAELDSATVPLATGSPLTALSANGTTLSWLHDGKPRSYVVPGR
jgi:hypothetical protein